MRTTRKQSKILVAVAAGLVVAAVASAVDALMIPVERPLMVNQFIGDFIAGLMAVIVCLAIQLRQEEVHYQTAIDRAAIVAELNHHVRNAVFPLCLVVQKLGDGDAIRMANEAVERINIALKDATADALSGRVDYGEKAA